ncbi:MAG: hypothetical protein SVM80_09615 [Halobacteriota archaeon]|nr:hypothetical protein [Halobacteriota archaeon]
MKMKRRDMFVVVILLVYAISMITPAFAAGYPDYFAICADKPAGYKDFTPHYEYKDYDSEPHFPPGSTIYVYVEATGKTKQDKKTGEYAPKIEFKLEGQRMPTGYEFSASTTSDKRINDDKSMSKKTYGIMSFGVEKDAVEGKYRIQITAFDKYDKNKEIAKTPYIYFHVRENATLYPPYDYIYKDFNITPNPSFFGQTVTASVNVTNVGGRGDLKGEDIVLHYDGKNQTKNLKLVKDETQRVEFKLSKNELDTVGTYNFTIGDLNETLVVSEQESSGGAGASGAGAGGSTASTEAPGFTMLSAISGIAIALYAAGRRKG